MPAPGEVRVWVVALDAGDGEGLDAVLSAAERERAGRLAFPHLRRRFVAAHAALRRVLGCVVGCPPEAVVLDEADGGKPFVPGSPWSFNLAHSGERAVVAVGREVDVGVDVEERRAVSNVGALAGQVLSAGERAAWADGDVDALLRAWVRKEAVVKAVGDGLRIDPATVDVSGPVVEAGGRAWAVHDLDVGDGYVGAVACPPGVCVVAAGG